MIGVNARGGVLAKLIVLMVVLAAVAVLAWILLLPTMASRMVTQRSGFPTTISRLAVNPFTGGFSGGGVHMDNPMAFGGEGFARLAEFKGKVKMTSLRQEEAVIETLLVDLTQVVVVVDRNGKSNVEVLGDAVALQDGPRPYPTYATAGFPGWGNPPSSVLVQHLDLRLGRLEVLDLRGEKPVRYAAQLDYVHAYENVRKGPDLLTPELIQLLLQSPDLWKALIDSGAVPGLKENGGPLMQLLNQASGLFNSLFRKLEQTGKP